MTKTMILQGREVSDADIELIRTLMAAHPAWGRTLLSVELCRLWDWRNAQGRLKDMAARTLLLKLERAVTSDCRRVRGLHRMLLEIAAYPLRPRRPNRSTRPYAICSRYA